MSDDGLNTIADAIQKRIDDVQEHAKTNAFRAFNGVFEGLPDLSIDIFNRTAVLHYFKGQPSKTETQHISELLTSKFPELDSILVKIRTSRSADERNGFLVLGQKPAQRILENGVHYAVDLTMNHDCGFYLDTRILREWLKNNSRNKRVLNTFAYTGSLGIAALAGGAEQVVQQDKSKIFLNIAKHSAKINPGFSERSSYHINDFFTAAAGYRKQRTHFDTVIIDPPFFSKTSKGRVALDKNYLSLINKIRPLVADNGELIIINNAIFVPGSELMNTLQPLFADGYITIQEQIAVPGSFIGYHQTPAKMLPTDPSPFGHSTKILILKVSKK